MVVRSSATGGGERGRRRRKGRGHADHAVLAPKPDFGVPFAYIKTVSDEWVKQVNGTRYETNHA
jgi:hypothetical protein